MTPSPISARAAEMLTALRTQEAIAANRCPRCGFKRYWSTYDRCNPPEPNCGLCGYEWPQAKETER